LKTASNWVVSLSGIDRAYCSGPVDLRDLESSTGQGFKRQLEPLESSLDDDRKSVLHAEVLVQIFLFTDWTKKPPHTGYSTAPGAVSKCIFAGNATVGIDTAVMFARI
jgi:hypothetical protein